MYRTRSRREELEDGTIYDYDPDQEAEVPNYINRYPPNSEYYADIYFDGYDRYKKQVDDYVKSLP